jgi:hypothetical protein
LLIFWTFCLWLGGTFVLIIWLHKYCEKISVLSCCYVKLCVILVDELCVNKNDLYVVVMSHLTAFHVDYYHVVYFLIYS